MFSCEHQPNASAPLGFGGWHLQENILSIRKPLTSNYTYASKTIPLHKQRRISNGSRINQIHKAQSNCAFNVGCRFANFRSVQH